MLLTNRETDKQTDRHENRTSLAVTNMHLDITISVLTDDTNRHQLWSPQGCGTGREALQGQINVSLTLASIVISSALSLVSTTEFFVERFFGHSSHLLATSHSDRMGDKMVKNLVYLK